MSMSDGVFAILFATLICGVCFAIISGDVDCCGEKYHEEEIYNMGGGITVYGTMTFGNGEIKPTYVYSYVVLRDNGYMSMVTDPRDDVRILERNIDTPSVRMYHIYKYGLKTPRDYVVFEVPKGTVTWKSN